MLNNETQNAPLTIQTLLVMYKITLYAAFNFKFLEKYAFI